MHQEINEEGQLSVEIYELLASDAEFQTLIEKLKARFANKLAITNQRIDRVWGKKTYRELEFTLSGPLLNPGNVITELLHDTGLTKWTMNSAVTPKGAI